jgi:hypothetical protein
VTQWQQYELPRSLEVEQENKEQGQIIWSGEQIVGELRKNSGNIVGETTTPSD